MPLTFSMMNGPNLQLPVPMTPILGGERKRGQVLGGQEQVHDHPKSGTAYLPSTSSGTEKYH